VSVSVSVCVSVWLLLPTIAELVHHLSILTAIFPGGPGFAGSRMPPFWILMELRVMEVVVTTGAIRHVKLQ